MMAAMAFIPMYSEMKMKNHSFLSKQNEIKNQAYKIEND